MGYKIKLNVKINFKTPFYSQLYLFLSEYYNYRVQIFFLYIKSECMKHYYIFNTFLCRTHPKHVEKAINYFGIKLTTHNVPEIKFCVNV
jgi:hypothetical protein